MFFCWFPANTQVGIDRFYMAEGNSESSVAVPTPNVDFGQIPNFNITSSNIQQQKSNTTNVPNFPSLPQIPISTNLPPLPLTPIKALQTKEQKLQQQSQQKLEQKLEEKSEQHSLPLYHKRMGK